MFEMARTNGPAPRPAPRPSAWSLHALPDSLSAGALRAEPLSLDALPSVGGRMAAFTVQPPRLPLSAWCRAMSFCRMRDVQGLANTTHALHGHFNAASSVLLRMSEARPHVEATSKVLHCALLHSSESGMVAARASMRVIGAETDHLSAR